MKTNTLRAPRALNLLARSTTMALALSLGVNLASAGIVPNGVDVQPSYYNNGNVDFGWTLMNSYSNIKSLRIEIEPGYETQAKTWIAQAKSNGKTIIATYHHWPDNGSDSSSTLQTAASWWQTNYSTLTQSGSFTVNLMNEWGSHNQTPSTYGSAYSTAISTVRKVYSGTIVCDIPGWGQETDTAASAVKSGYLTDTNIALSTHIYPGAWNQVQNHWLQTSDLDTMASAGRSCSR